MKTPLAWRNVVARRARSFLALFAIGFAIVLIFMQLGFHAAARTNATTLYQALDFDIIVLSSQYVFAARPGDFPRSRLEQVRAISGIESVVPLWVRLGEWRNPETRERWNILALGLEPWQRPFREAALNAQLPSLAVADTALADVLARPEHGTHVSGTRSELQHHRIRIVGQYSLGGGFVAGATLVTSRASFVSSFSEASTDRINVGLVKVVAGASPDTLANEITQRCWPLATAWTRDQISRAEQAYWLKVKPIGIMFTSGLAVALIAGAVILYQVLAAEVQSRLREYATLKALGYTNLFIYGIVIRQALLFSLLGFIPAFLFALLLYALLRSRALIPVTMEPARVLGVSVLTLVMCLGAAFLAIRKLRSADPADLF